ncbi:MupA/Atu3671 family FMN-dependent luciferase-like monooxygenase [Roseivirga sp. BDSF3-8]|uniref:MupA/Atu3671 family FMN-dependent luciferase-like monooxygenase n=1 Tax=Roseivirga sp. BDSF3-8 TaxID=3241598 RepID=UPI003531EFCC
MGDLTIKNRLTQIIRAGIRFEVSDEKLRVKGDLKVLTDEDKQFLKANKEAIIGLLQSRDQELPLIKRADNGDNKTLSFSQQSLWLLDRINNGSQHYNLTSTLKLKGKLDYDALNKTFRTILQRHESLRSVFSTDDSGNPVQTIQSVDSFQARTDEIDAAEPDVTRLIQEKVREEAQKRFDLSGDLLLSVRLIKLQAEEHILVVTMHHIASDGWSIGILINEFSVLYSSYMKGEGNPLPKLELQYADYARWQRDYMAGDVLEKHKKYWKGQLSDLPVLHSLPLDYARPNTQSFKGDVHRSQLEKGVVSALTKICREESASLFMGLHSAFSSLLSRYSNETDIVVGSPVANRSQAETANLVGFFMNILVLRTDLSKAPSLKGLIRQSKEVLEGAYEHQQMPFEKVIESLDIKRSLSHSPLFQVLLTLHNTQEGELAMPGLVMEKADYSESKSARYDLSLDVIQRSEGMDLTWEYNTDLFKEDTIARLAGDFNTLLSSLVAHPDKNIFEVNMVGDEKESLYASLKGDTVSLEAKDGAIASFITNTEEKPQRQAVICNDVPCTYEALGKRVDAIAEALLAQGVASGDKVGLCLLRNEALVAAIFACFKIGATYIPLDPVYPKDRIGQILDDADPKCVVTLSPLRNQYLSRVPANYIVCLDLLPESPSGNKLRVASYGDDNVAYIIFTSGSTGRPKGIEVTHGNLKNLLKGFDVSFGTGDHQRWLAQTSVNFDISVLELIWTISRGQTIVLQQTNPFKLLPPEKLKPAARLDFSVMFFGADKSHEQKYDLLLDTAKYADAHGFTAIWTPERHFGEFGGAFPNPSVISSALSLITKNLQLRSGSVVLPLHDPVKLAEDWSLVDNLSKGRIGMSIASGWQPDDFVLNNEHYHDRREEMRDKIEVLKKLWKGEGILRKNGIGKDFEIRIRPRPVQNELPLWITAAGNPDTFKYAGEIGANVLTHMLGQSLERLEENIKVYHQALNESGHKAEDKVITLMLHTYIDETEQLALGISEKPFKEYLGSSIKLMEPLANELGLDVNTQAEELIDLAFQKFSRENTLFGSPESVQGMLQAVSEIGVTELACLVDFGVEVPKVLENLGKIVETRELFESGSAFAEMLNIDNQKTELDLIDEYSITHVQMTPSQSKLTMDLYKQTPGKKLTSVKHWFIGGEALNETVVEEVASIAECKVYNMYGPTETTVWSAWREVRPGDIRIGGPVINTDLLLLNTYGQAVPVGVVGELYIGGEGVTKGYYNNEKLTHNAYAVIDHPYFGKKRFYRTGDLMKYNGDGTFDYVSRKDNQVKVNGYRVELEDIEKTIGKVPGVKNCKVVPAISNNTTFLSAYVVKEAVVHGNYTELPFEKQARPFYFPDGSTIYHQSDRQLGMLYKEIIEDGIYFKHGISVPEDGLVMDVGSNIGTFSIDVSRRQPSATVVAFEPIPQIFSALKKNFEHHQIKGRVLNYGVSDKKENATFYYYPEMAGMSGRFADQEQIVDAVRQYIANDQKKLDDGKEQLSDEEYAGRQALYERVEENKGLTKEMEQYLSSIYAAEEVDCKLTTISDVIDEMGIRTVDLLKVDVEKSECLVLEGIRSEHWSMIRHMALEVDGDKNLGIITKKLREHGYEVNVEDLVLSDADVPREENTYMLYATNNAYGVMPNNGALYNIQAQANENAIREYLKSALPEYMVPKDINFVPAIPLMENGKVDMVKLKATKSTETQPAQKVKLANQTEQDIYALWCEVLKKDSIPYHVSIFEAGGNSIEIVRLHEKMQKKFDKTFSLIELFRNPTIAQQAKLIQNAGGSTAKSASKAKDKGAARRNRRINKMK